MEELKIVLDEIRGVREDIKEVGQKVSAMEAMITGELGIIKRMNNHEKQTNELIKEIHTRLSSIEKYITNQKVYLGILAAIGGAIVTLVPKLVSWLFKL